MTRKMKISSIVPISVSAQACGSEFYGRTGYSLSAKGGTGSYKWNGVRPSRAKTNGKLASTAHEK